MRKHRGLSPTGSILVFKRALNTCWFRLISYTGMKKNGPAVSHPYPVSNFELASRLSYFLWSSSPDDALLDAAYREDLHDPSDVMRSTHCSDVS